MTSTDIGGTPVLILRLQDVKVLQQLLDRPETPDQTIVVKQITQFINDPQCISWEEEHDAEST